MEVDLESYLSKDADTYGFDLQAGKSWIYPTNYPMREYQFRMAQEALYQNTLVSLPTGLGKTFIAAVVMYNYYRWYPVGKIIFMAPTRPLVKQQIEACYDIMAIPQSVTAELTGTKVQTSREEIWKTKRVFFITPQILQNDIDTFPELAKQIKCLVFDEAHKARGNHAYCEVIRKLIAHSKNFRVLALSATPGNSTNDIIDVSINLLISHLEVRTEDSPDVTPYVFQRELETVIVPLGGKLEEMRNKYLRVLEKYMKVLKDHKIITGNCANLTKGKIFMTLKDFNQRQQHQRHPNYSDIVRTLNICITLYHGYELLIRHGMRGFLNFFEEHSEKVLLRGNSELYAIMEEIQQYIGPRSDITLLPDGTIPQIADNSKFGHPKFYKLRNIVLQYFSQEENKTSKIIVFSEFKETVMEAYAMLMQHTPIVRPKYFMGQGAITQKQQISIIKTFRDGECNTLISTCIGEEGLDIGAVDLIICFDISNKSPIRLIQRMGRTGRKKQGKVIILVTEGKEQELLKDSLASKNYLANHILKSHEIPKHLYKDNPRMIPENIFPTCHQMHISVPKVVTKGKSGNIKDMLNNMLKNEQSSLDGLSDVEIIETQERIPSPVLLCVQSEPLCESLEDTPSQNFNSIRYLDRLRLYQPAEKIGHSADTNILVSLLQLADSKRYNLPVTQTSAMTQVSSKKSKIFRTQSSDNFKQTDIRNMFVKSINPPMGAVNEELPQIKSPEQIEKKKIDTLTNDLLSEISSFMVIYYTQSRTCNFCAKTSLCNRLQKPNCVNIEISGWTQPDMSFLESVTETDLDKFLHNLTNKQDGILNDIDVEALKDMMDMEDFGFNEMPKTESIYSFEVPKSIKKVIGKCNLSINIDAFEETFNDEICKKETIQGIETLDINNEQKPEIVDNVFEELLQKYNKTFQFFNLNQVEDLFCDEDNHKSFAKSPDLFSESPVISTKISSTSPIVSKYSKRVDSTLGRKLEWNDFEEDIMEENPTLRRNSTLQNNNKSTLKSKLQAVSKSNFYVDKKSEAFLKIAANERDAETLKQDENTFQFFKLNEIDDLFKSAEIESFNKSKSFNTPKKTPFNQPTDIFPVICSELRWNKEKRKTTSQETSFKANLTLQNDNKSFDNSRNKNLDEEEFQNLRNNSTITLGAVNETCELIQDTINIKRSEENNSNCSEDLFASPPNNSGKSSLDLNIADICDISFFGLTNDMCSEKSNVSGSTANLVSPSKHNTSNFKEEQELTVDLTKNGSLMKGNKSSSETIVSVGTPYHHPSTRTESAHNLNTNKQLCIDLTGNESPDAVTEKQKLSNNCDSPESPVFDYTFPAFTQKENHKKLKSPKLSLDDLCDPSIFDTVMTLPDSKDINDQLSPVLTQKFIKPTLCKSRIRTQRKVDFSIHNTSPSAKKTINNLDICDLSSFDFDTHKVRTPIPSDVGVSVTQIIDLINKPTGVENDDSLLNLLDDDNVFTNMSICKTPVKSTSRKKTISTKRTPKSNKKRTPSKPRLLNSDDEFETPPPFVTPKKRLPLTAQLLPHRNDKKDEPTVSRRKNRKRKKKAKHQFIDDEAVLSSDEYATDDTSSEGGSSQDAFEMSFVTDVDITNTTTQHVKYLQSVRSPLRHKGAFKIPDRPIRNICDVFSQKENLEDNTYLEDSFCVDVEDSEITVANELSELELAEKRLEEHRKQRHKSKDVTNYKKRRRVVVISSDSD